MTNRSLRPGMAVVAVMTFVGGMMVLLGEVLAWTSLQPTVDFSDLGFGIVSIFGSLLFWNTRRPPGESIT